MAAKAQTPETPEVAADVTPDVTENGDLVLVKHPTLEGVERHVPKAQAEDWIKAGWVK